jgi:hypothetical protein
MLIDLAAAAVIALGAHWLINTRIAVCPHCRAPRAEQEPIHGGELVFCNACRTAWPERCP